MGDRSIMKEKYFDQAVDCVKDYVLPAQIELYRSCAGDSLRIWARSITSLRSHSTVGVQYR